jgi:putative glutamine amidotransferase
MIEGIERTDGGFILGVQWHPERMIAEHPVLLDIFKTFIAKC